MKLCHALLLFQLVSTNAYEYDFIVVGSGTGGIVASRLAEAKHKVLLIEAGPDDLTFNCTSCGTSLPNGDYPSGWPLMYFNPAIDPLIYVDAITPYDRGQFWNFNQTQLMGGYHQSLRRNKILGGCSTGNGGVFTRGDYRDFDYVSQVLGCKGWGYNDIIPYFNKLETYYGDGDGGTNGPVQIVQKQLDGDINIITKLLFNLSVKAGYPPNPLQEHSHIHYGVMSFPRALRYWDNYPDQRGRNFNAFEMRQSSSQAYIRRIGIPSNHLTIWTDTMVQRVLFDLETKTAIGVEYYNENDNLEQVYCNKEIIVSGGYVKSPQLLMLSGIGSIEELVNNNIKPVIHISDKIGRYGQDNLLVDIEYEVNEILKNIYDSAVPNIVLPYNISNRTAGLSIINATNVYETNITDLHDTVRYQCRTEPGTLGCIIETNLRSKNMTINLKSNDSRIYPNVYRYHFSDVSDYQRIIDDIREFRRIISFDNDGSIIREIRPGINISSDEDLRKYIVNKAQWAMHEVGTLSMGPKDDDAVDLKCSVNGVNNLRVVDTSIWPSVRVSGTMSLSYMIGEKCSKHILDSYSKENGWFDEYGIYLFIAMAVFIVVVIGLMGYFYCKESINNTHTLLYDNSSQKGYGLTEISHMTE